MLEKLNINPEAKHWQVAREKALIKVETTPSYNLQSERERLRKGQEWLGKAYQHLLTLGAEGLGSDKQKQFLEQLVRWLALEREHREHGATECIWDWPKCDDRWSQPETAMVATCSACFGSKV